MAEMQTINERVERENKQQRFLYKIDEFLDTEFTVASKVTATVSVWLSACIVFISSVLYIVGFSTTGWGVARTDGVGGVTNWQYGLWEYCGESSNTGCYKTDSSGGYLCSQLFACLALVSLFVSVLILVLYCMYDHMKLVPLVRYGIGVTRVATSIFLLIAFTVYSNTWYKDKYQSDQTSLSYSFALTVTTFVLETIASILMLVEMRNQSLEIALKKQESMEQLRHSDAMTTSHNEVNDDRNNATKDGGGAVAAPYELFKQFTMREEAGQGDSEIELNQVVYDEIPTSRGAMPKTSKKDQSSNAFHYNNRKDNQSNATKSDNIYNEINSSELRKGNQSSYARVPVDVHSDNMAVEPPQRPNRQRHSKPTETARLHSYENIPDGATQYNNYSGYANGKNEFTVQREGESNPDVRPRATHSKNTSAQHRRQHYSGAPSGRSVDQVPHNANQPKYVGQSNSSIQHQQVSYKYPGNVSSMHGNNQRRGKESSAVSYQNTYNARDASNARNAIKCDDSNVRNSRSNGAEVKY